MTAHISVNDKEFQRRIKKILKTLDDRRSFFAQAVTVTDKMIQKNFEEEGKLLQSSGWAKLAPSTERARKEGWGEYIASQNFRILQNTGALKDNWKHLWTARFGKIQSGVVYGTTHHYGNKKMNIPARPILPDEKHLMPKLIKILSLWIKGAFKK